MRPRESSARDSALTAPISAVRPAWLSPTMHLGNSVTAWADVFLAKPRSFRRAAAAAAWAVTQVSRPRRSVRSARWSCSASLAYAVWIQVVKSVHGSYPYPVLNQLPHPHGFFALATTGFALFGATFMVRS